MPMNRALYPDEWAELSAQVRHEAGWKCEWCGAIHGFPHPITGSKVVLTVAHIDQNTENNARENLVALCQRCHLRHDHKQHMANSAATRRAKKRNLELDMKES